jgi:hypothetical protein
MAGVPFLAAQAFPARGERVTEIIGINPLPAAIVIVVPPMTYFPVTGMIPSVLSVVNA